MTIKEIDIENVLNWKKSDNAIRIPFIPSRCVLQDFSAIPAILNLISIREKCDLIDESRTQYVNPICPTDLVLDHAFADVAKK